MQYVNQFIICLAVLTAITGCQDQPNNTTPPETPDTTNTQEPSPSLANELTPHISPINATDPSSSLEDMSPLSSLANARVVGLGEATHGTKEFFQLKHKVFKYLVKEHGFKAFAFEADMVESYYLDEYITGGGEGDLLTIMQQKMHFWPWYTESVKNLLEWMRSYNQGKSPENMIRFMGVDAQYISDQPAIVRDFLQDTNPQLLEEITPTLQMMRDLSNYSRTVIASYDTMSTAYKDTIFERLETVIDKLDNHKTSLIASSSLYKFRFMRQFVRNMQQVNDVRFADSHNLKKGYRDKYMAENTLWLQNQFGSTTKIALWGHNWHISTDDTYYNGKPSMGYHLQGALGENYQAVGFGFSKGTFRAVSYRGGKYEGLEIQVQSKSLPENSLNRVFNEVTTDNFIFKVQDLPNDNRFRSWIHEPRLFLSIGAAFNQNSFDYYQPIILKQMFDVILYIDNTSASELPEGVSVNAPPASYRPNPSPLLMER